MRRPPDLATVRLVTERYRELQGLRVALPGAVNLIAFGAYFFGGIRPDVFAALTGLVVCLALGFIDAYLNEYYASRFGFVDERGGSSWLVRVFFAAGIVGALGVRAWGAPAGPIFIALATPHLWVAVRDFPRRSYHIAGFLVAIVAATSTWGQDPLHVQSAFGMAIYSASVIPVGLLDHQLLSEFRRTRASFECDEVPSA